MTDHSLADVRELAQQLRVDSIRCSTAAGSGHPTSSMSAADVMAVLLSRHFRYDWEHPDNPVNDHLIFSKGHASPLLYSMFKAAGVLSDDELMTGYRRSRGGRLRRRSEQLHPRRGVHQGVSRALLRDVHRRAATGGGCGRTGRARLHSLRLDLRGVFDSGP